MTFINNIKESFAADAVTEIDRDRGDLVQTLILTAGFAIAALTLVNWFSTAILNKAADTATCIEGSNTYKSSNSAEICKNTDHSKDNSFKKDGAYKGRFS